MRIFTRAQGFLRKKIVRQKTPMSLIVEFWIPYWEKNMIVHLLLQQEFISPHPLVFWSSSSAASSHSSREFKGHERQFYLISMSYAQLLPRLLEFQLVKLLTLLLPTNSSPDSDGNTRCDSHSGAPDHDDKPCKVWKYKKSRTCSTQGHLSLFLMVFTSQSHFICCKWNIWSFSKE